MLKALSYYSAVLKNPARRDFIDMGYGIDARFKRSKNFWEKHLSFCKDFAARVLEDYNERGEAWILGAGSLLDLDISHLENKFSEITLFDANIALKKRWTKAFQKSKLKTNFVFKDITGNIDRLTNLLNRLVRHRADKRNVINFFEKLSLEKPDVLDRRPDVIFSVNILSQIPIYWRDRVHSILLKSLGLDTNERGNYEDELQAALEKSLQALQKQHLSFLNESDAKLIVLISDSEFMYYTKDKSPWQSEKALFLPDLVLPNYSKVSEDSWFWHIAPQGIEEKSYGVIHNVKALSFKRV